MDDGPDMIVTKTGHQLQFERFKLQPTGPDNEWYSEVTCVLCGIIIPTMIRVISTKGTLGDTLNVAVMGVESTVEGFDHLGECRGKN